MFRDFLDEDVLLTTDLPNMNLYDLTMLMKIFNGTDERSDKHVFTATCIFLRFYYQHILCSCLNYK